MKKIVRLVLLNASNHLVPPVNQKKNSEKNEKRKTFPSQPASSEADCDGIEEKLRNIKKHQEIFSIRISKNYGRTYLTNFAAMSISKATKLTLILILAWHYHYFTDLSIICQK